MLALGEVNAYETICSDMYTTYTHIAAVITLKRRCHDAVITSTAYTAARQIADVCKA